MSPHLRQVRNGGGDVQWGGGLYEWNLKTATTVISSAVLFCPVCCALFSLSFNTCVIKCYYSCLPIIISCKWHPHIAAFTLCPTNPSYDASAKSFPEFLVFFCGPFRNNGYRFHCNLIELTEGQQPHGGTFWVQEFFLPFKCIQEGSTKHS
jgi:hypothetical protein